MARRNGSAPRQGTQGTDRGRVSARADARKTIGLGRELTPEDRIAVARQRLADLCEELHVRPRLDITLSSEYSGPQYRIDFQALEEVPR